MGIMRGLLAAIMLTLLFGGNLVILEFMKLWVRDLLNTLVLGIALPKKKGNLKWLCLQI